MRRTAITVLLCALCAAPRAADKPAAPPAVAEVRAFMAHVERVSRARDIAALGAALATDCRIELRTVIGGQERVTLLTRAEYVQLLADGEARMKDLSEYDYRVSGLKVTTDREPPGATVVSQVHESFTLGGKHFATDSRETARVERRGGELKLVAVSSETQGD
jgi:hypothetical protein